jgi:hypothetical protein
MKRDDFGVRIDEIRELATKYSKPDLARMVQMGMLDPQRALMAGMMIDRIAKSAMQPPTTTVAEDVLSPQPPTTAQGQMPPGIMAAAGAPAPSEGVAALPSGMREMAGGGIVAFADGGDIDDYADGGVVAMAGGGMEDFRRDPASRVSPRVQAQRDQERQRILMDELADARARLARGDPRAQGDIEALTRDLRKMIPKPSADAGITSLLPSAQAGEPMTARAPAAAAPVEDEASYDPMTGLKISGPEPTPYSPQVKPGTRYEPNIIKDILQGSPGGARPAPAPVPAAKQPVPPTVVERRPAEEKAVPAVPAEPEIKRPQAIEAQQLEVPKERTLKEEAADIKAAYQELGVDVDMYKNQMKELEGKKAGLAQRKEKALGAALMAFGFGLAGAREGQVFQQLGKEGQKALGMYMNDMDRIAENEDRIDMLNRQLQMAENNFRRTGADSALTQMRARRERIEQVQAKNAELKQRAAEHQATLEASVYQTDVVASVRKDVAAAQAAAKAATAGRAGALTQKQRFDIEQQLRTELEPKLREKYKNVGSEAQINSKVEQELRKAINARINELASYPSGYGGNVPAQDMFAEWSVEGM